MDVDESFQCKWRRIEKALYSAIGHEHNVTRLYNFIDKNGSDFHSSPLELLIDQVEDHVNAVVGKDTTAHIDNKHRTVSDFAFATKWKYILIMQIMRPVSGDFKVNLKWRRTVTDCI